MSITANIADNVVRLAHDPINKTIQVRYVERKITKPTVAAEMKYYAVPGTDLYKNIPIQAFRQASKDPLGTVGKFLPDGHKLNAATITYFRLRWIMFNRIIAANGELSGADLTIKLADFPLVDQVLMSSPTPYEPPEEVTVRTRGRRDRRSRKSSKRHRFPSTSTSDSDALSEPEVPAKTTKPDHTQSRKRSRSPSPCENCGHAPGTPVTSDALVPAGAEVSTVVARYLPHAWAADPSARTRAEAFARSGATEQEFTEYVREEDTRAQRERMEVAKRDAAAAKRDAAAAKRDAAVAELKTAEMNRPAPPLTQCQVRAEYKSHFDGEFAAECARGCGKEVTLAEFFVLRHLGDITICCRTCFYEDTTADGRTRRKMDKVRVGCWKKANGRKALGVCFVCKSKDELIEAFLDPWEVAHDVADCHGGRRTIENCAPTHPHGNREQGGRTFAQYFADNAN